MMMMRMRSHVAPRAFRALAARQARALLSSRAVTPPVAMAAEEMPTVLRRRVAALEGLHAQFEELEEEHHAKLREVEISFQMQAGALFERRSAIVSGADEPTEEEVQNSSYFAEFEAAIQDGTMAAGPEDGQAVAGVPAFWPTALRTSDIMQHFDIDFQISDKDWAVLDYLVDLKSAPWEDEELALPDGWDSSLSDPGFALHFTFAPNPYLETLSLSLYCNGDGEVKEATTPIWVDEAANPLLKQVSKKMRKKGGGDAKVKVVTKECESFFRIFAPSDYDGDEDETLAAAGGGGARGDALIPLVELQNELIIRLREDMVPRAAIHYISALHGFDDEGDDMVFDADEGDDDEWMPPPSQKRR